ncbi:PEPxxWA-CTERM sorting domain-containing protein [Erythrobacter sp. QSSC1-22B]|uniref:PEPxxWA-CTERM sorting domain-containing protein n=1 Tax=Erythrobacter sp. QSSC1-22B TaxID=1860125 RepID=UPI0009F308BC|nr:PEPxxWA-CTERM sorting domain-containing protein [Erythrobacter sp. QSSC1-22B]
MISTRKILVALTAAVLTTPASAATVIDFDELKPDRGRTYVYGSYESNGYRLSSSVCPVSNFNGQPSCFVTSANTINNIDRVGAALVNFAGSAVVSLERIDGSVFTLESLVLASNTNNSSGFGVATQDAVFNFNLGDGSTVTRTETISSTGVANRNLLSFNVGAISSFSFRPSVGTGGFLQFDDITVSQDVAGAVPEPSTWAMMLLGFGFVGGAMRSAKRRHKLTVSYA